MVKKILLSFIFCTMPLLLMAQDAEDIIFYKPGYNIEKVLEVNKVIQPHGSCFDADGNLLVTNWYSAVYQISPEGSVSRLRYGGYGTQQFFPPLYDIKINPSNEDIIVGGEGIYKFNKITGDLDDISPEASHCYHLTFDENGNLFASMRTSGSRGNIQKYNLELDGNYTHAWTELFSFLPRGIVFDSSKNLYVCDYGGGRIIKLAPPYQGVAHETLIDGLSYVFGIAIDVNDNLYVLADDTESPPENWYTPRSSIIKIPKGSSSPELVKDDLPYGNYITVYNGEIYFSAFRYNAIKKIDIDGNLTDFTEDNEVKYLYTMTSDLEGTPIVYDSHLGKTYKVTSSSQIEILATDMGNIYTIATNAAGELYCYTYKRENVPARQLFKIPMDGSDPELVFDFDGERTVNMKFFPGENNRLALLMSNKLEIWEFDLMSQESTVIAENVTSYIAFDLDAEHNLFVGEGLSVGIKKAPYPTMPPVDVSQISLHITMSFTEPEAFRFFEVAPTGDVYIPVANPNGEIHIGPSGGGKSELLASGFSFPNAAQLGRYGRLWVADAGNGLFKITNQENIASQNVRNCDYLIEEIQESGVLSMQEIRVLDGIQKALISKLENAKRALEKQKINSAIEYLIDFRNLVQSQKGKKISEDKADRWIAIANGMIKVLQEVL